MSSARASIGRLQSRLAFIPDEEPEPEAAAAAAAAPSVTANIASAITDRVDANRVDTSVVFQTANPRLSTRHPHRNQRNNFVLKIIAEKIL